MGSGGGGGTPPTLTLTLQAHTAYVPANACWPRMCGLCAACRFSLVKKYEVEFNKAALSLAEGMTNVAQKKAALNRLLKVRRGHAALTHVHTVWPVASSPCEVPLWEVSPFPSLLPHP